MRSVIPADPAQLLFLSGIVCLTIGPRLRLTPSEMFADDHPSHKLLVDQARSYIVFSAWAISVSGIAAYFICFWPGRRPVRRILLLVFAPALTGLVIIFDQIESFIRATSSVLEITDHGTSGNRWPLEVFSNLPPGIHFCLAGLLLIAIYTSRLAFGIARLPLTLPGPVSSEAESPESQRLKLLIWVLLGPLFLLGSLYAFITILLPTLFSPGLRAYSQTAWFSRASSVAEALFVLSILLWIMGTENRQVIWDATHLPEPRYVALGLAFPVGIALLLSTGQFFVARAIWAAHDFGKFSPPQFRSYFDFPNPWLLVMFFFALFEELIFRGLLQRRFVEKYGVYRGIFLVGMVWAAYHFVSDFAFSGSSETRTILQLGWRILFCLTLSYVLGWLTLRFNSILPAAAAHTFYNVLVRSGFGPPFLGKDMVLVALWAILAVLLFRYWPIQTDNDQASAVPVASPEPVNLT